MGILCFLIAVVPKSNSNSMYVMKAEVPGPKAGKVTPKISESARTLYIIYSVLPLLLLLLLILWALILMFLMHFVIRFLQLTLV